MDNFKKLLREAIQYRGTGINVEVKGMPEKFWVVVNRAKAAQLGFDPEVYETTTIGLMLEAKGGLDPHDVAGFYKSQPMARKAADKL